MKVDSTGFSAANGSNVDQATGEHSTAVERVAHSLASSFVAEGGLPIEPFAQEAYRFLDQKSLRRLSMVSTEWAAALLPSPQHTSARIRCDQLREVMRVLGRGGNRTQMNNKIDTLVLCGEAKLEHFSNLPVCSQVQVLRLEVYSSNILSGDDELDVATAFPNLSSVCVLKMSAVSALLVGEFLRNSQSLRVLELTGVQRYQGDLMRALKSMPASNTLETLRYSEQQGKMAKIYARGQSELMQHQLATLLANSQKLKVLHLSGGFPHSQDLCDKVLNMPHLQRFELHAGLRFSDEFVQYMLQNSKHLTALSLSHNPIGSAACLVPLLDMCPKLESITWWENGMNTANSVDIPPRAPTALEAWALRAESSLKKLGQLHGRLKSLTLKVSDWVSESAVIQAAYSVQPKGHLVLGQSAHVTDDTLVRIKRLFPDMHVRFQSSLSD